MRRTILVSLFFLGACGGGMASTDAVSRVPPGGSSRADAYSVLMSAEGQAVVDSFASSSSQDALDTCIADWLDSYGSVGSPRASRRNLPDSEERPTVVGLRAFVSACLQSQPGDFKADSEPSIKIDSGALHSSAFDR